MNRRHFLGTAALGAVSGLSVEEAEGSAAVAQTDGFPEGFWWGAATAAYQIEGAARVDGRKPSIWDTFSHTPGKTERGDTGDVACDHYHLYERDVALMRELGVKHYRFSIAWPRIIPDGRGTVNEKGVDFYRRLVDALLRAGVTPHATLYHWDLPQALQDRYEGWQSREVVDDFAVYAHEVVKRLGDRITNWMTLNEIATFARYCGYGVGSAGEHAPGLCLARERDRWQVCHHALLAHGKACQAIRAASPTRCCVGIAENFESFVPVIETLEHVEAARKAFTETDTNGAIITPLLTGRYDPVWWETRGNEVPQVRDGDLKTIAQPLDALGFNCYTGNYVASAESGYEVIPSFDGYPKMNMPWLNVVPESIYWGVRMLSEALGARSLRVFVSENGCADGTAADADGHVNDIDRVMYLRAYLRNVKRAHAEGYPIVGYFPWSLIDNFEWACGYEKRFGLTHVDFNTQTRTPKLSYHWYREVIRSGRVV